MQWLSHQARVDSLLCVCRVEYLLQEHSLKAPNYIPNRVFKINFILIRSLIRLVVLPFSLFV